jgi:hypothetical protein
MQPGQHRLSQCSSKQHMQDKQQAAVPAQTDAVKQQQVAQKKQQAAVYALRALICI